MGCVSTMDHGNMALGDFAKRLLRIRQQSGGEPGKLEPVSAGADRCEPAPTDVTYCAPLVFGSLHSAKEHAQAVAEMIRDAGALNSAIYAGDIAQWHARLCEEKGWLLRKWDAVGRELARLPGVRKGQMRLNGERLTVYEFAPPQAP